MYKLLTAFTATIGLAAAAPVGAAQFNFAFATETPLFGGPVTGNGIFTTSNTAMQVGGNTAFTILSISGFVNGSAIVAPTGNYGNYFTTGPGFLDGTGTRFSTAAGNSIAFFQQSSNGRYRVNTFSPGSSSFVTASSSAVAQAVPEPTTWAMLIAGFGIVGMTLRSRRRTAVLAHA